MKNDTTTDRCEWYRRLLSESLDGRLAPSAAEDLAAHLGSCGACETARQELLALREELLDLPTVPLPADALEEVWARTVDAPHWFRHPMREWGLGAAAAAILAVALLVKALAPSPEPDPSPEEVKLAAAQALYVLGVTNRAIEKSEDAALNGVLGRTVSPALEQIPIQWPAADAGPQRSPDR